MEELVKCFTAADALVEAPPQLRSLAPYKDYHGISTVRPFNALGQMCVTRRAFRAGDPDSGKWQSFLGGHVLPGEEFEDAAVRELYEEVGLVVMPNQLYELDRGAADKPGQSMRVWRSYAVRCPNDFIRPNESEITSYKWMRLDEYDKAAKEKPEYWCALLHPKERRAIHSWLHWSFKEETSRFAAVWQPTFSGGR
jgi:8-oxo-dGTP pyrophosphatase MutT (NUDIX family)